MKQLNMVFCFKSALVMLLALSASCCGSPRTKDDLVVPIEKLIANGLELDGRWIQTQGFLLVQPEYIGLFANLDAIRNNLFFSGIPVEIIKSGVQWPPEAGGVKRTVIVVQIRAFVYTRREGFAFNDFILKNCEVLEIRNVIPLY